MNVDSVFWATGVALWTLGGMAAVAISLIALTERILKETGTFLSVVLTVAQRSAEKKAIRTGDEDDLRHALSLLRERVAEGRRRKAPTEGSQTP